MRNAQKPERLSLNQLVTRLGEGKFVIPDFQRDFEWKPRDICDLIRSIFLDYYIGSLLLWRSKEPNTEILKCEHLRGYSGKEYTPFNEAGDPDFIVLDGQQRLTALYYAFYAPDISLPKRHNRYIYYVNVKHFMNEEYDKCFNYDWTKGFINKILSSEETQFERHIFPLSTFTKNSFALPNWLQNYQKYWENRLNDIGELNEGVNKTEELEELKEQYSNYVEHAKIFSTFIQSLLDDYQVSYIELNKDIALDKVCDIFTQINSKGVQLDVFDLINALLRPHEIQLKDMWREISDSLSFVKSDKLNVYVLQVMSILRQNYCSPKYLYYLIPNTKKTIKIGKEKQEEVLISSAQEFRDRWSDAAASMQESIKLLSHPHEYGVTSSSYMPYVSILPVFSAIRRKVKSIPANSQLSAQRKMRSWYWASVFTNRYSGSMESTSTRDFIDVSAWLDDDDKIPSVISEFKSQFKTIDFKKENRSSSSRYNGIFNLLTINGAKDWVEGTAITESLDDHHIVPRSWGKKHLGQGEIDTILNRTPLTASTNRNIIRDRLPNEYIDEWISINGEEEVRKIMEQHCISPIAFEILKRPEFTAEDFEKFINERQKTITAAVEDLLIKERLDLSPSLRVLDADIEKVEVGLRDLVSSALIDRWTEVPSHVQEQIEIRIQKDSRTNHLFDHDYANSERGKLDFSDLRHLQTIISAKPFWQNFESKFKTKQILEQKFKQLTDLRNGIRHAREVNNVVKMEGEAAIIWFSELL